MRKLIFILSILAVSELQGQNVGIGNSSPNAPLQFQNIPANRKIVLFEAINNDHQFYGFGVNGSSLRYQTASLSDDHIFFSANSATSSTELLRIKGNGNVGIGVLNPAEKLEVAGKTITTSLQVTAAAGTGKVLTSDATGNASWQVATNANTGIEVSTFANQSVNTGILSKVVFDNEITDHAAAFNTANSEWVTPSAGFYHINAAIRFFTSPPTNSPVVIYVMVNGISIKQKKDFFIGQSTIDISADMALLTNDIVTIHVLQNSGAPATILNGRENTYLSGFKVY
jgi:hypothetical protein